MKHSKQLKTIFTLLGLLAFFLLCLVPSGYAQKGTPVPYANNPAQLALSWTFTSSSAATGGFTARGLSWWQIYFIPSGTISGCSLSLDSSVGSGFNTGGIISSSSIGSCASAGSYTNASGSATTPTLLGQVTPTITGTGSVIVVLFGYVNNPAATGGGGGGGSNAAASATGSGVPTDADYGGLNVGGTLRGQTGVNPFGSTYAAQTDLSSVNGSPFSLYATLLNAQAATGTVTGSAVRAPSQSAYGVLTISGASIAGSPSGCSIALEQQQNTGGPASSAYFTQSFTPSNTYQSFLVSPASSAAAADDLLAVYSCSGAYPSAGTITATFAALNTTLPAGFSSSPVAAQQAVTASAAALPSNSVHSACVQASPNNGFTIYVGPSGVTTSTGFPLPPGQGVCYQVSNTNLIYVIASATGASVSVTGN